MTSGRYQVKVKLAAKGKLEGQQIAVNTIKSTVSVKSTELNFRYLMKISTKSTKN